MEIYNTIYLAVSRGFSKEWYSFLLKSELEEPGLDGESRLIPYRVEQQQPQSKNQRTVQFITQLPMEAPSSAAANKREAGSNSPESQWCHLTGLQLWGD